MKRCLVNGEERSCIPADDPGFLRGLVCFDTMRTYGRIPFRLAAHMARLEASAAEMGIDCPTAAVLEDVHALLETDVWIRVTLTAGGIRVVQAASVDPDRTGRGVHCARLPVLPSPYLRGSVKHGSRAAWVLSAEKLGVDEVLFVADGEILEANRSSVIAVLDGVLVTPVADGRLLDGVTRRSMLDAAARAGLQMRVGVVPADADFEELYLASTLKELSPVLTLDGAEIGGGDVGESLHSAFRQLVQLESQSALS
ncbi:MAG TPA: aminotransferase class IV [Myxococcota bacterium]|nr:aminotransferase class IV [Myxococcota bacterium]